MPVPPKPSGYSTVSPYLIAVGAQAVIDFLKQAFGAEELRRDDLPDGSIIHAEVRIGDTVVMLGDAGENWPAMPAHLHVYVDDVDETYRRALGAGGLSVQPPERKGQDPDRRGGVKDRLATPGGLPPRSNERVPSPVAACVNGRITLEGR